MAEQNSIDLNQIYPSTLKYLSHPIPADINPHDFPEWLQSQSQEQNHPAFLSDLARLEQLVFQVSTFQDTTSIAPEKKETNPSLQLLLLKSTGLTELLKKKPITPEAGEEIILVYKQAFSNTPVVKVASSQDLLALKIVAEELELKQVAKETGATILELNSVLLQAEEKSLIYLPETKIQRPQQFASVGWESYAKYKKSRYFTLQWHITQRCDMFCQHCYDRTLRNEVTLEEGFQILDQLEEFAKKNHVTCQVTFTGGNPLMHKHFYELYQSAVDRGFLTGILGNPMPVEAIKKLVEIRTPEFYQISLEGLEEHNDIIRGKGSFQRGLQFLDTLREQGIYSMVMLTLTDANMDQVIPLADVLRNKSDQFTFNRLSNVGQGAALASAEQEQYREFLERYTEAAETNPVMSFKDSFFNILRFNKGLPLLGGCTGYGCGAAFNFVSLLPDGEVHACRKFPSLIGNLYQHSLDQVYEGDLAEKYRNGASECYDCKIRPACGGCLAVAQSSGRDPFTEKDPYCFFKA